MSGNGTLDERKSTEIYDEMILTGGDEIVIPMMIWEGMNNDDFY
jgi:hypothetical protein